MTRLVLVFALLCVTTVALAQPGGTSMFGGPSAESREATIEVRALAPTPTGVGLSIVEVQRAIEARRPQLLRCYDGARRTDGSLGGTVTFQMRVAPSGTIHGAPTSDASEALASVARCMARELTHVRVTGATHDAEATVPVRITLRPPAPIAGFEVAGS